MSTIVHVLVVKLVLFVNFVIVSTQTKCICVSPEQCERNYGAGLLDVRLYQNTSCTNHSQICCNPIEEFDKEIISDKSANNCGYQNLWSGSLLYKNSTKHPQIHKCGVSIIHNKAVLTAAHCLLENGTYSVKIGNIVRGVLKIIKHPDFKQTTLHNDIALLLLSTPIQLSRRIGNVCLPRSSTIDEIQLCQAAIWITKTKKNRHFSYLKTIKLRTINGDDCMELLRKTKLGGQFQLHQSFLCALSGDNYNICKGDGGSPLMCPVDGQTGRLYQIGIVSWGVGCGDFNLPGVYTKLSHFKNWIDQEMVKNGLDTSLYDY